MPPNTAFLFPEKKNNINTIFHPEHGRKWPCVPPELVLYCYKYNAQGCERDEGTADKKGKRAHRYHALRPVLWRGKSDLPRVHGTARRKKYVAGDHRLRRYRRRPAASRRSRYGHQPQQRPDGTQRQGQPSVQLFLYLRAVPDHRSLLCHSPLRHHALHRSGGDPDAGGLQPVAGAGDLLAGVLRRCAGVLTQARQDPHPCGQDPDPYFPGASGGAG